METVPKKKEGKVKWQLSQLISIIKNAFSMFYFKKYHYRGSALCNYSNILYTFQKPSQLLQKFCFSMSISLLTHFQIWNIRPNKPSALECPYNLSMQYVKSKVRDYSELSVFEASKN